MLLHLYKRLNIKLTKVVNEQIEMMLHVTTKKMNIFDVTLSNLNNQFELKSELGRIDKLVLLNLQKVNMKQAAVVSRIKTSDIFEMDCI